MTLETFKDNLQSLVLTGFVLPNDLEFVIQEAIKQICNVVTPLSLVTKVRSGNIRILYDSELIVPNGQVYYLRTPLLKNSIDIDDSLIDAVMFLCAFRFAQDDYKKMYQQKANILINAYSVYLYDLTRDDFSLARHITPYYLSKNFNGSTYIFSDDFIAFFDDYFLGKDLNRVSNLWLKIIDDYKEYGIDNNNKSDIVIDLDARLALV